MYRRWLASIVLLAAAWPLPAQQIPFKSYNHDEGLDNLYIRCLLQDKQGFLWVGTTNGVYRFDGLHWLSFHHREGVPGSRVFALHETADGRIFAGTEEGLAVLRGSRFEQIGRDHAFNFTVPGAIASHGRNLFLAGNKHLFVLDLQDPSPSPKIDQYPAPPGPGRGKIWAIHVAPDEQVWVGCADQLCRWDGHSLVKEPDNGLPVQEEWSAIQTDGQGALWVRSTGALYQRPRGSYYFKLVSREIPPAQSVVTLNLTPNGHLVVPSELGLYFDRDGQFTRLAQTQGLPADQVATTLWDRAGNLWVGMENFGLARRLGGGKWKAVTTAEGLTTNTVTAVQRGADGVLWIGTKFGLNSMTGDIDHPQIQHWNELMPWLDIRALAAGPKGEIWAGNGHGGLFELDRYARRVTSYGPKQGLRNTQIVSLYSDRQETLWVTTRDGVYTANLQQRPIQFEEVSIPAPGGDPVIYRLLRTQNGTLWAVGRQGLLKRAPNGWKVYGPEIGLSNRSLVFLTEGKDGELWIGYSGVMGIARVVFSRDGVPRVENYREDSSLASDNISFIESDAHGRIWIGTDRGVDLYRNGNWRHFDDNDGMVWRDSMYNSFLSDADGSVWIGTSRGLARYGADDAAAPTINPVLITSYEREDGTRVLFQPDQALVLPGDNNSLRLQFASLTYSYEKSLTYSYRMAGRTDNWIQTRRGEAVFDHLPAGHYVLELRAARLPGPWTEPTRLEFDVLAPWWQTGWFRGIAFLGLLLLGRLIYVTWLRRHRQREKELEEAVTERTREIEWEKAIVEKQKRDIEELLKQAREASRLKDEFLANISHEIRTPMNAVLGMTALALATPLDHEQRDYLENVDSSARSLLHLLNEILDFSKIEAAELRLERIAFAIQDVTEGVYRTVEVLAKRKNLRLIHEIDPALPEAVMGDPTRLRQILLNLHSNAIKFTETGQVVLRVIRRAQSGDIVRIYFEVADTGIGIDRDHLDLIFDPFRQADGSTTRRYGGTGLGLAICRRLVEAMGGRIHVASSTGLGSRFSFEIPLEEAPEETLHRSPFQPVEDLPDQVLNGVEVLLVEDNDIGRKLAERLLQRYGCRVTSARNGREAIEFVRKRRFDMVLMDLQMPEIDGLSATRWIREQDRQLNRRTPILILSANARPLDRMRAMEAGADAYLTKPIDSRELRLALQALSPTSEAGG